MKRIGFSKNGIGQCPSIRNLGSRPGADGCGEAGNLSEGLCGRCLSIVGQCDERRWRIGQHRWQRKSRRCYHFWPQTCNFRRWPEQSLPHGRGRSGPCSLDSCAHQRCAIRHRDAMSSGRRVPQLQFAAEHLQLRALLAQFAWRTAHGHPRGRRLGILIRFLRLYGRSAGKVIRSLASSQPHNLKNS